MARVTLDGTRRHTPAVGRSYGARLSSCRRHSSLLTTRSLTRSRNRTFSGVRRPAARDRRRYTGLARYERVTAAVSEPRRPIPAECRQYWDSAGKSDPHAAAKVWGIKHPENFTEHFWSKCCISVRLRQEKMLLSLVTGGGGL